MITVAEFDDLVVGDGIDTAAPFPSVCPDVIELICVEAKPDRKEFDASWRGINIGKWAAMRSTAGRTVIWLMSH